MGTSHRRHKLRSVQSSMSQVHGYGCIEGAMAVVLNALLYTQWEMTEQYLLVMLSNAKDKPRIFVLLRRCLFDTEYELCCITVQLYKYCRRTTAEGTGQARDCFGKIGRLVARVAIQSEDV